MATPASIKNRRAYMKKKQKRLFDAAKNEEIWSTWSNTPKHIDQIIYEDLSKLVAKSREQYANNDYVKRFVNLCQTNIVGENGIRVQSTVTDRKGNSDLSVQQVIERAWDDFSVSISTCGRLSRPEFESAVIQSCVVDGDAFVYVHTDRGSPYGVSYSLIDAVLCDPTYVDTDKNIINGIEYDNNMRPVAYHFLKTVNKHFGYHQGKEYQRISADKIIHVFMTEWTGQKRGIPWVATSLGRLRQHQGWEDAAVTSARVGATKMGFFTTADGGEYTGEQDDLGNLIMEAEPGSFEQLPEGVSLQSWDPNYPSSTFGDFASASLRGIAMGLGVAHHSLCGDMSQVNYTQGRAALLDERDMWKRRQQWLISQFTRKVYGHFINYGVDFGRINFNGSHLREKPEHYLPANYQGRRWAWVDPIKDAAALKEAVSLRIQSLSGAIREQGRDPETVWREYQRDLQTLDLLGIKANIDSEKEVTGNDEEA